MTKQFGVLKFRGTHQFHKPLDLVFESDDPVAVMHEMQRLNATAPYNTGYLLLCKKAEKILNSASE